MNIRVILIISILATICYSGRCFSQGVIDHDVSLEVVDNNHQFLMYYKQVRDQLCSLETTTWTGFMADTLAIRGYEDNDPVLFVEGPKRELVVLFFLQDHDNYVLKRLLKCSGICDDGFVLYQDDVIWVEEMWFSNKQGYKLEGIYADSRKILDLLNK